MIQSGHYIGADAALACSNRCFSYEKKGQYDLALADCDEALRLEPDYPEAFLNRA